MLPGQYRPLLRPGMPLRLELVGYRYEYQDLVVESIGDEIVGPQEIRRYLGGEIGDTVFLPGPVILVEAHLSGSSFTADGTTLSYYDGMHGRAEARLRSRRILSALLPGFESVLDDANP